jgi:glycosyltransferase involved in cell wall biosynthesis
MPQSAFLRSVSILVGGTALAQALNVFSLPVITRLFTPDDFSMLAVYMALLSIVSVVACLRFEIAIPLPQDNFEAFNLMALSLIFSTAISAIFALVVGFFSVRVALLMGQPALETYLWLLPVGIWFTCLFSCFQYWVSRTKKFVVIAKAKVLLAPLRFGAGLKGKLLEAMQCGTPSITTEIGAEGMNFNFPWGGNVEDSPESFATSAAELYSDEYKWNKAQKNGFDILANFFDYNLFEERFIDRINEIFLNLKDHRDLNFLGSILLTNQLNSTKYFSRWIEEKNKKGDS